ncbi:MAG: glycoside hydrolase family 3 N-terminal domain-containing protein [Cyanobacteria bacterium J06626_6]
MLASRLPSPESLTLEEQVAQMMVVRTTGHLFDHELEYPQWEATNESLKRYLALGVGGVILLGGSAAEVGVRTQQLQSWAKYPLFMAADIEEGVGQRFSGATWFAPPMALGEIAKRDLPLATKLAGQMGAVTAQEAAAIGLNWLLGPVVDVNNNSANPVINVRAFGEEPEGVARLSCAFIQGTRNFANGGTVLTCAKHFPGHGDTDMDSHLSLPVVTHDFDRLQALELVPFKRAIAAGVDSIMTAHLRLTQLDADYPATLSKVTLSGLLRHDLGFDGLIVTDALVMGGITERYGPCEAAVLAVEAGADILLMPDDVEVAIAAVCESVDSGRISSAAILRSVERIWRAKHKIADVMVTDAPSRHAWQHHAVPPVQVAQIATDTAQSLAAEILRGSQQVSNAPSQSLSQAISAPLIPGQNILLVDDALHCPFLGRTAPAVTIPSAQGYSLKLLDSRSTADFQLDTSVTSLVQLFIRGNPFRHSAGLSAIAAQLIQALGSNVQAVVIYGSPYVWRQIQVLLPLETPCVFTYGQMKMAQAIALQPLLSPNQAINPNSTTPYSGALDGSFTD